MSEIVADEIYEFNNNTGQTNILFMPPESISASTKAFLDSLNDSRTSIHAMHNLDDIVQHLLMDLALRHST